MQLARQRQFTNRMPWASSMSIMRGFCVAVACTILLSAAAAWACEPVAAEPDTNRHELWVISTRHLPSCGWQSTQPTDFDYQRFDSAEGWVAADSEAFSKENANDVPTCFFIHGNQLTHCEAIAQGRSLYRVLSQAAGDQTFRLAIWSWPTTRIRGRIRHDVQVKAARSDIQAFYLAQCVDRMPVKARIAMVGHSFGARVITGSLEILAGGSVACNALETTVKRPHRQIRAVLVAAAVDNGCLLPGRRNGLALQEVDRMLITQNCNDRVLRWYPRLYGCRGPEAMGYTGPAGLCLLGENQQKIDVLGVSCSVGRGHGWYDYLCSCSLQSRLPWYAFLEPTPSAGESDSENKPTPAQSELSSQNESAGANANPLAI